MAAEVRFAPPSMKLGTHIPLLTTLHESLYWALEHGMNAVQVFLGSPQSFTRRSLSDEDVLKCKYLIERYNMTVISHAPYVYNMAKKADAIPSLEKELHMVAAFGGNGVVLHPGSHPEQQKGLETLVEHIGQINFREGDLLLIENMAGQGNVLGSTLKELAFINDHLPDRCRPFVYFCVDTAHLWGRGEYHIETVEGVRQFWKDAQEVGLCERIRLCHLNDSKVSCGSCIDRHECIADGEIWSTNEDALKAWVQECTRRGIAMVMETDPSDMEKFLSVQ